MGNVEQITETISSRIAVIGYNAYRELLALMRGIAAVVLIIVAIFFRFAGKRIIDPGSNLTQRAL